MGNKRYNNVLKAYMNGGMFTIDYECIMNEISKEKFTEIAYKKIDLFIKRLYESMCSDYMSNDKTVLLCQTIQKVLKNNLYNNSAHVVDFICNILQIPDDRGADYGVYPSFSYSYNKNLILWGTDLVIQVVFADFHCIDENTPVFQIRCHYSQEEGQYNEYFEEYINESENFFTTDDFYKYYGKEWECGDEINISIARLSYHTLWSKLYDKDTLVDNINEFHRDMEKVK